MSIRLTSADGQHGKSAGPLLSLRALVLLVISIGAALLLFAAQSDAVGAAAVGIAVLATLTALVE